MTFAVAYVVAAMADDDEPADLAAIGLGRHRCCGWSRAS